MKKFITFKEFSQDVLSENFNNFLKLESFDEDVHKKLSEDLKSKLFECYLMLNLKIDSSYKQGQFDFKAINHLRQIKECIDYFENTL